MSEESNTVSVPVENATEFGGIERLTELAGVQPTIADGTVTYAFETEAAAKDFANAACG